MATRGASSRSSHDDEASRTSSSSPTRSSCRKRARPRHVSGAQQCRTCPSIAGRGKVKHFRFRSSSPVDDGTIRRQQPSPDVPRRMPRPPIVKALGDRESSASLDRSLLGRKSSAIGALRARNLRDPHRLRPSSVWFGRWIGPYLEAREQNRPWPGPQRQQARVVHEGLWEHRLVHS